MNKKVYFKANEIICFAEGVEDFIKNNDGVKLPIEIKVTVTDLKNKKHLIKFNLPYFWGASQLTVTLLSLCTQAKIFFVHVKFNSAEYLTT